VVDPEQRIHFGLGSEPVLFFMAGLETAALSAQVSVLRDHGAARLG
jgi:hypothetical protein